MVTSGITIVRHTSVSLLAAAALGAVTPLAAQAQLVIDQHNIGVGSAGTDSDGFITFASGVMDIKAAGPYTGVGVSGGHTRGEIDIGESIGITFDQATHIDSFRLGLLYNGPEYGDVRETARIQADQHTFYLRASGHDNRAHWFDGSWNLLATVAYEFGTGRDQGAVIALLNPFGNRNIESLRFSAVTGPCASGTCSNQSDYNLVSITAAVPEPSTYALMFVGLAGVAFMARRRRNRA